MADFSKDSAEFNMFADYYNLTKKWYEGAKTTEEYGRFTTEINGFADKYKGGNCGLLAKYIALGLNNYVDALYYAYKETGVH